MANSWYAWIYLLKCGDLYKIGFSAKPSRRVRHLQTGSPEKVHIVHVLRSPFYRQVEKALHRKFSHKRMRGEWFRLDAEDVEYIKSLDKCGHEPSDSRYDPSVPAVRLPPDVVRERRDIALMQGHRHAKLKEFFWSWN